MTPLGRTALGLLLVLLDLRVRGFDVLPDVLGWILVVVGVGALAPRCPGLATVRTVAVAAGVLSLADLVHPTPTTSTGTGSTSAAVPPEGLQGLLSLGALVAALVVVVLLSLRLRDLATAAGDERRARTFGRFAVYHALVGGVTVLLTLAGFVAPGGRLELSGAAAALFVVLVVAALVVEAVYLLVLCAARNEPWAAAAAPGVVDGRSPDA